MPQFWSGGSRAHQRAIADAYRHRRKLLKSELERAQTAVERDRCAQQLRILKAEYLARQRAVKQGRPLHFAKP